MTEKTQWYYVEKQDRKGPVSTSTMKKLVGQGVITEQTLVWKEGMDDWEPASKIKGLIEKKTNVLPKVKTADPNTSKSRSSRTKVSPGQADPGTPPGDRTESPNTESSPPESSRKTTPVAPQPTATPITPPVADHSFEPADDFSIQPDETTGTRSPNSPALMQRIQILGYPFLIVGFLMVIGSKGCDSLGNRWASRLSANARIAEDKFNYGYERKRNSYQSQIDSINDGDNPNTDRINDLNKRITDLNKEQSEQRQKLSKTTWFELDASAKMAQANNQAWGFFRELGFVFGSMVLSIGLLVLGITGNTSEKWTCLIMLAIITFSIYIGGFAWFSSIAGNMPGGMGL